MEIQTPGTRIAQTPNQNLASPEDIQKARQISGEQQQRMFYVPTYKVNNVKIKEEINGEKIEKQPIRTFLLEDEGYQKTQIGKDVVSGVILKYRSQIISKMKVDPAYESDEFDRGDVFSVHDFKNKSERIFKGNYGEVSKHFEIGGENRMGKPNKSFDFYSVIYCATTEGLIFKIISKIKTSIIDYQKSFSREETHLNYITNFGMEWIELADGVDHWSITLERGEVVELKHYMDMARELTTAFDSFKVKQNFSETQVIEGPDTGAENVPPVPTPSGESEINLDAIPF